MWVARDKDGELDLYLNKPNRCNYIGWTRENWDSFDEKWIELDSKLFPDLTLDDEPIEVEIVRKN